METGGGTLEPLLAREGGREVLAREGGRGAEENPDTAAKETRADIFEIL